MFSEGCFSIDKWYGNDAWKIEKNVNSVLKCGYTCLKNRVSSFETSEQRGFVLVLAEKRLQANFVDRKTSFSRTRLGILRRYQMLPLQ